mmetsp:Transcript_3811/g.11062  ORF Transcript_3811/g.11062 Transcript_3811/m.11062 type:complete len:130 (+) Transcript_3811:2-391(+)
MMAREQRATKLKTARKLDALFVLGDRSQDGFITMEEFRDVVQLPAAQMYFNALDLKIVEACDLFTMLDDGDGKVNREEFCTGVMRLKGQARSADMISVMRDCRAIMRKCNALEQRVVELSNCGSFSLRM